MIVLLLAAIIIHQSLSIQLEFTGRLVAVEDDNRRIIQGEPCFVEEHPYMVSIRLVHEMTHFCGGTIISEKNVLTAAHCISDFTKEAKKLVVVGGITANSSILQIRHVEKIHVPPSYNRAMMVGDIGILLLEHPFTFGEAVQPVLLNRWHSGDVVKFCIKGLIIGWGSTKPQAPRHAVDAPEMLCAEVPIISFSQCQRYLNLFMEKSKFCAFGNGKDACLGDSGGPMMCGGVQIGVISTGNGCGSKNHPGIYARVDYHFSYIQRMMNRQSKAMNISFILIIFPSVILYHFF